MNALLIAASTLALIKPGMNEAERYKAIAPYISPAPGSTVKLSPFAIAKLLPDQDPLNVTGSIVIKPPKGTCFTVTKHPSVPDIRVCEETAVNFNGYMLDWDGSVKLQISTGIGDPGYEYRFPTPHRIAKVVKMGERPWTLFDREVILGCTAYTEAGDRRVVLDVLKDKKWVIRFPKQDVYKKEPHQYDPNDMYFDAAAPKKETGMGKIGTAVDPRKQAVENAAKKEHVATYWMSLEHGAYTMPAANFSTVDTPGGSNGECLYQYNKAYGDPLSGWIECHYADEHDAVYFSIPCAQEILEAKQSQ